MRRLRPVADRMHSEMASQSSAVDAAGLGWVARYQQEHRHRVNRNCHLVGIPLVSLSIVTACVAFAVPLLWWPAALLFGAGWAFQIIGHRFAGNSPSFLHDPRMLLVGPIWWVYHLPLHGVPPATEEERSSRAVADRVFAAQIDLLYRQAPASLVFSIIAASLVCWLLASAIEPRLLVQWFALTVVVNVLRLGLVGAWRLAPDPSVHAPHWARWFVLGTVFNGVVWGLCGMLFLHRVPRELEFALIAILGVIPGISFSSLSVLRAAFMAFVLPFIGPVAASLLIGGKGSEVVLGVSTVVFIFVLNEIGKRGQRDVVSTLTQRFQNEDLLVDVRNAQTSAERASAALMVEVAERQRTASQLVLAKDAAERANHAKTLFLANTSHEIRTPMNGVLGMNELLLASELQPQQRKWAEAVHGSGRHLLEVIDDILDFSRIESGRVELEQVDFDLAAVVRDVVQMLTPLASAKKLELHCEFDPPDAVPMLRGDPFRLRQVITNLAGNAVKFTDHGQVVIRVNVRPAAPGLLDVGICVEDTGIGIAIEAQEKVFEHFFQADGSTTRKYEIGRASCRERV